MADVIGKKVIKGKVAKEAEPISATITNSLSINAKMTTTPSATEDTKGLIRIATELEAIEGLSGNSAITPFTLRKATNFVFEQGIASNTWVVNHNLNKRPSIIIVDTLDRVQIPDDIYYNSDNTMTVTFLAAFAGKAYLN